MSHLKPAMFAALTIAAAPAMAEVPKMSRAEIAQLYGAGGFPITNGRPVDGCGAPARPSITFIDMNGDRRPEALFVDRGQCYLPDKAWFAIAAKGPDGRWRQLVGQNGTARAVSTRTFGWLDLQWTTNGRTQPMRYDGVGYAVLGVTAAGRRMAPPPILPVPPKASDTGDAAIYRAAGFTRRGGQWRSDCDDPGTASYGPGAIETRKDLNGDGRPEAVVTEGGTYCYGNTGTGFWLVSQQADGSWKRITNNIGIPEFLKTKGVGGWPDILIGGPGFCFPVQRWNGRAYVVQRREYQGRACK